MRPVCKRCGSASTRRTRRLPRLIHRIRYLFGFYPWECINCHHQFFSRQRHPRGERSPGGEVYTGPEKRRAPKGNPEPADSE